MNDINNAILWTILCNNAMVWAILIMQYYRNDIKNAIFWAILITQYYEQY